MRSPWRAPPIAGLSLPAYAYTYVFRGTPLLVQLWVFYYGFGALGAEGLGPFWPLFREAYWVGVIVLTINTAAYAAEIFRGGIANVAQGQIEAATAMGMSWWTTMRRIVLPQAFRIAWPAYSNEVVLLLKGSALVSTITVLDLMGQTRTIFARSYSLDIFIYAAVLYLALSGSLTVLLRWHGGADAPARVGQWRGGRCAAAWPRLLFACHGVAKIVRNIHSPKDRGVAQPGSASGLGPEGRKFKSCRPDQYIQRLSWN